MKNYTQVYVKNSFEAAEIYCKAYIPKEYELNKTYADDKVEKDWI